jgi:putative inorganic carbon (hco3(-)) transporter
VTADRSQSQSLHAAPPVLASTDHQSPRALTLIAETVTRYGLPAFILCLPLEFTSQVLRFQLARIVLLVVGAAFAYLVVAGKRKLVVPARRSIIPLALYVVASLLSWSLTRAPGSLAALLDVAAYPVVALLVTNLAPTTKQHETAWTAFLLSGLGIALLTGFLYYAQLSIWRPDVTTPLHRVNATFGDPNILARFLTLAVGASILLFGARRLKPWLTVGVALVGAAALPLTFSKSGYVLFPLMVALAVILATSRRRAAVLMVGTFAVLAAAILINPATRDRSLEVVQTVTGTTAGAAQPAANSDAVGGLQLDSVRTYLIQAGWQMFKDHPVFGVGYGGFQHALLSDYSRFLPPNNPSSPLSTVTLSHTSAIKVLAEQGLVGAGLLLTFLLMLAWTVVSAMWKRTEYRDFIVTPAFLIGPILLYSQLEGRLIEEPYLWLAIGLIYSAALLDKPARLILLAR